MIEEDLQDLEIAYKNGKVSEEEYNRYKEQDLRLLEEINNKLNESSLSTDNQQSIEDSNVGSKKYLDELVKKNNQIIDRIQDDYELQDSFASDIEFDDSDYGIDYELIYDIFDEIDENVSSYELKYGGSEYENNLLVDVAFKLANSSVKIWKHLVEKGILNEDELMVMLTWMIARHLKKEVERRMANKNALSYGYDRELVEEYGSFSRASSAGLDDIHNNRSKGVDVLLQYSLDKYNKSYIEQNVNSMIDQMTQGIDVLSENTDFINQSGNKSMGYAKVWLLGLITSIISVGIILLGIILK